MKFPVPTYCEILQDRDDTYREISTFECSHVLIPGGLLSTFKMMRNASKLALATPARASVFAGPILFLNLLDSRFTHSFWEKM